MLVLVFYLCLSSVHVVATFSGIRVSEEHLTPSAWKNSKRCGKKLLGILGRQSYILPLQRDVLEHFYIISYHTKL